MLSFSATICRFTPPTCTLEIKARRSSLVRWTNKKLLNNLQFQLSFDDPRIATEQQVTIQGDRQQLEQLYSAALDYTQGFLTCSFQNNQLKSVTNPNLPHFQPQGLVSHQLFLGSLATKNTEKQIQLSAVQLFDLVTALEAYNSQIANLPNLTTDQQSRSIPLWGTIAAGSLLVVGLTAGGIKLWQSSATQENNNNIVTTRNSNSSIAIPKLNEVKPPDISDSKSEPTPQPRITEPLSSTNKLPPPPAVDLPKPQPDIPDPAQYPLPEVAQRSGFSLPTPNPDNEQLSQTESTISIAPQPDTSAFRAKQKTKPETAIAASPLKPEDFKPKQIDSNLDQELQAIDKFLASNQSAAAEKIESEVDDDIIENSAAKLPLENNQQKINNEPKNEQKIALNRPQDSNPQLQEITAYFQEKWQPPAKLTQSLEYRLLLNSDGSLQRVIPLGKVSEIYLDRTNIPLRGEAFISPFPEEQKSLVRLLLSPDGEVTAFAE